MDRASHTRLAFLFIIFLASTAAAQQTVPDAKPAQSRMISGRVVSESGQPLAGANVFAGMPGTSSSQRTSTDSEGYFKLQGLDAGLYRDSEGARLRTIGFAQPRLTDDRGYYRIYGLAPGTYVVSAGGQGQYFGAVN